MRPRRRAAEKEEAERGPISEKDARVRVRVRRSAGESSGAPAFGSRLRKEIKKHGSFKHPKVKKTRTKKRGRR